MSSSHPLHPLRLKITATPHGPDLVIALEGALAAADAVAAQVQLLELAAACTGRIVLDCTQLTYIASVGLRALLALHRNAADRSRGVILAGVTEPVRDILSLAGLLPRFPLAPSVPDALR